MVNIPFNVVNKLPAGLGPIKQICFVTKSIPASAEFWTRTVGVGPFFHMQHVDLRDITFEGRPTTIDQSIALAYWGDLQIELLEQHNDAPSIYRKWANGERTGVHHAMLETDNVETTRVDLAKYGWRPIQKQRVGMGGDCIFFEINSPDIPFLEVVSLPPLFHSLFEYMKRAARAWDGSKPLRDIPPESEWA